MSETKFTIQDDKRTLVVERVFSAPRHNVWQAWTTPELFAQWWGPKGWKTEVKKMEFSEGGELHYGMKCEDPDQKDWYGKYSWGLSTYHSIKPEDGFDYDDAFCDENAVVTPGMPVLKISMQFIEEGEFTRVVSTSVFDQAADLEQVIAMGMKEGLTQTWDRLEELVSVKS